MGLFKLIKEAIGVGHDDRDLSDIDELKISAGLQELLETEIRDTLALDNLDMLKVRHNFQK